MTEIPFFEWSLCNLLIRFEDQGSFICHCTPQYIRDFIVLKVRTLYLCYPSKLLLPIGCIFIIQPIGFSAMSSKQELLGHLSLICRLSFTHPCTGLKLKSICYKIHRVEERSADLGVFACVTAPLLDGRSITAMETSCLWSGLCICISVCMCLCGSFPRLPSITSDLRPPVQTGSFFFLIHFADTWNACFSTCTEY